MIFIDPSELRSSSMLLKYISDVVYESLVDLEAISGADVMISPDGLPFPRNEKILQYHVDNGSKLIQIKFGHDLPTSIIDGRLNEALSRMLSVGANPWQCLLLFVGLLGYDDTDEMAIINGQLTYGNIPMKWYQLDSAIERWIDRGGSYNPLFSGKLIHKRFSGIQQRVNEYQKGVSKKLTIKPPRFERVIEPDNPHLKKWGVGQKIEAVDDIRQVICSIPGVRIGPEKATAILEYMAENDIRQDLNGFLDILRDSRILEIQGIGKGLQQNIRSGLFKTLEERKEQR